jgi:hypothetical protein
MTASMKPIEFVRLPRLPAKQGFSATSPGCRKRNYAKALDDLFAFCASRPLSRGLLMEWRAGMESLALAIPSSGSYGRKAPA